MSVDPRISCSIVRKELRDCEEDQTAFGWQISPVDDESQLFMVTMTSPVDGEKYIMEVAFDNYKEWPLLIEFVDSATGAKGVKHAYPAPSKKHGGFFHENPCICHPCSRKAYKGLHADWEMAAWQLNPKVGSLTTIRAILNAIYARIRDPESYNGRMNG
jgi:hypothetical protein